MAAQAAVGVQVYPTAQKPGEFPLQTHETQTGRTAGLELHQHVNVALRPEFVPSADPNMARCSTW